MGMRSRRKFGEVERDPPSTPESSSPGHMAEQEAGKSVGPTFQVSKLVELHFTIIFLLDETIWGVLIVQQNPS